MAVAHPAPTKPPDIARYDCHRSYVQDYFEYKKGLRSSFSYRRFSTLAGFKSPNYLLLVMQGKRNLSNEAAEGVARAMGLRDVEQRIFCALVRKANARTEQEATLAERDRLVAAKQLITKVVPSWQVEVHSRWYHPLVRELVFFPGFQPTGEYIAEKLNNLITPEQAWDSFVLLQKSGFIRANPDGSYEPLNPVVDTGDFLFSRVVMDRHHRETLQTWAKNIETLTPALQERGLINIPIAASRIPELRERMRRFQDEIIAWLSDETDPDSLVQLGTYLMPVTVGGSTAKTEKSDESRH